jgi:hypothetical protein
VLHGMLCGQLSGTSHFLPGLNQRMRGQSQASGSRLGSVMVNSLSPLFHGCEGLAWEKQAGSSFSAPDRWCELR